MRFKRPGKALHAFQIQCDDTRIDPGLSFLNGWIYGVLLKCFKNDLLAIGDLNRKLRTSLRKSIFINIFRVLL